MSNYSLANHFGPFVLNANVANLPMDTHALSAMIVPRGLLVIDNPHQHRLSAPAGHTTVLAIAEVHAAAPGAACSPQRAPPRPPPGRAR
jgi:hypothetical protein